MLTVDCPCFIYLVMRVTERLQNILKLLCHEVIIKNILKIAHNLWNLSAFSLIFKLESNNYSLKKNHLSGKSHHLEEKKQKNITTTCKLAMLVLFFYKYLIH
ncbi:hypothetical protein ACJX0J_035220, partial [Zea mays]